MSEIQLKKNASLGVRFQELSMTVPWNLALITLGSLFCAFGLKAVAEPHGFISGGVYGLGLYLFYVFEALSPAYWYLLLNIPIFILGWVFVSRRFFFYSLYGMLVLTLVAQIFTYQAPINDKMLAAFVVGATLGAGMGVIFRTVGSAGGLDIVAVILNQKFNLRMGQISFAFNLVLFSFGFFSLEADLVLFSMISSFISAQVADYFMSLFNQRKMVLLISDKNEEIARDVLTKIHRGATFLYGRGAYTRNKKKVLMIVVNNYQLKRLEEAAYAIDPKAFIIVENTFNVLGSGFSRRKVY